MNKKDYREIAVGVSIAFAIATLLYYQYRNIWLTAVVAVLVAMFTCDVRKSKSAIFAGKDRFLSSLSWLLDLSVLKVKQFFRESWVALQALTAIIAFCFSIYTILHFGYEILISFDYFVMGSLLQVEYIRQTDGSFMIIGMICLVPPILFYLITTAIRQDLSVDKCKSLIIMPLTRICFFLFPFKKVVDSVQETVEEKEGSIGESDKADSPDSQTESDVKYWFEYRGAKGFSFKDMRNLLLTMGVFILMPTALFVVSIISGAFILLALCLAAVDGCLTAILKVASRNGIAAGIGALVGTVWMVLTHLELDWTAFALFMTVGIVTGWTVRGLRVLLEWHQSRVMPKVYIVT